MLRQDLLAPILSIEGHAELLKEQIEDEECLSDLKRIESAATLTRTLVDEMLAAETRDREDSQRDSQRSGFKHDLGNSVGAISGYSEITLEELEDADELSKEAHTYLDHQLADSGKLLQMLDTLFQNVFFATQDFCGVEIENIISYPTYNKHSECFQGNNQ